MLPYIICFVCLLCCGKYAAAQELPALLFKHLNNENGLAANNVLELYKDTKGLLWISTENGLTRFDGQNTKVYRNNPKDTSSLPGNFCNNIIEDKVGNLWIGTQNALARYNRSQDNFTSFYFAQSIKQSSKRQYVFPFYIDNKERLWLYLGADGSVYTYALKTKTLTPISSFSNGHLFATQPLYQPLPYYISRGVKGIIINYLDRLRSTRITEHFTQGNKYHQPTTYISQLHFDHDSLLWLCSDLGLIALNPRNGNYKLYNSYKGDKINTNALTPFGENQLLVGTEGHGLLVFDKAARTFTQQYNHQFNNSLSLSANAINFTLLDKDKNLFVAVADRGVDFTNISQAIFKQHLSKTAGAAVGIENNIVSIVPLNSTQLLCATKNSGVAIYNINTHKVDRVYTAANAGLSSNNTLQLLKLKTGDVLIHTLEGFSMFDNTSGRISNLKQSGLPSLSKPLIHNLQYLSDGMLLAATESGLMSVSINKTAAQILFIPISEVNNSIKWEHVCYVGEPRNNVVIVQTYYTELYAFNYKHRHFTLLKTIGTTPYQIFNTVSSNDTTYLATSAGLRVLNNKVLKLDEGDPLIDMPCNDILLSTYPTLWVSTTSGLCKYNYKAHAYTRFTKNEGLQDNLFNPRTFTDIGNNLVAAAGINGINVFNPSNTYTPTGKYNLQIDQVLVNDVAIAYNNKKGQTLELPYYKNTISIAFSSTGFINPELNNIHYELTNYETYPVKTTGKGNVRYTQLAPGEYDFNLYNNSDLRKPALTFHIIIHPPFWQAWWFRIAILLAVAGIGYTIIRLRINSIKQRQLDRVNIMIQSQEEERRRIARDLHDDFGARLSTLKMYMQAAQRPQPDNGKIILQQSAGMIDQTITELRNILANLSPKTLEENGLQAMLSEMAGRINAIGQIHCHIDTVAFKRRLHNAAAYAIYRICQELVNNTIKYAVAKNIYITIVQRSDVLVFLYEDDGKGFDIDKIKRGYGLTNIETHVQALKGTLLLDAKAGHGFATTIELPLAHIKP